MKMAIQPNKFHEVWVPALVASLVTLVVSPLMFYVNEYLSRPILSIEYVEAVPEEQAVSIPTADVQALLHSDGVRTGFMRGIRPEPGLMEFMGGKQSATATELTSMKNATEDLIAEFKHRKSNLVEFQKVLENKPSEDKVREVAAKYQGSMMSAMAASRDVKALKGSLLAALATDNSNFTESIDLGQSLINDLNKVAGHSQQNMKLKLSVLNRGSTDGLIRSAGELEIFEPKLVIKLKRTRPPVNPNASSLLAMAVPVAVANPNQDIERPTSVGSVAKNSMSEFWMGIDKATTSKLAMSKFNALANAGKLDDATVVLFDQNKERIERRFHIPEK